MRPIRIGVVTNIPAPYRVPVFDRLAAFPDVDLTVFYAAKTEPDRSWELPAIEHPHVFLRERIRRTARQTFIHNNPDLLPMLRRFAPDVVITGGYNPTHLYAFAYSQLFAKRHVAMTDGTLASESGLSRLHLLGRHVVLSRSTAFVAASRASRDLLLARGVSESKIFFSPLCANTSVPWPSAQNSARTFDLLFSGRLVTVKNPLFALDVAAGTAAQLGRRISIAVLGSGELREVLEHRAAELADCVDVTFAGHVSQADMPRWFGASRIFLFPTSWDPWGVVVNEACTAGLPIIVSPHAGSAGELVIDGENGYVRRIDLKGWVSACVELLSDDRRATEFSRQALRRVEFYTFDNAALGMASAARHSVTPGSVNPATP